MIAHLCSGCGKPSPAQGVRITVATYNVHHFRSGYHAVRNAISSLNADIVALQEVPVRGGSDYSEKIARDLGYKSVSSGMYYRQGRRSGWVLSFLSRYPVTLKGETSLSGNRVALRLDVIAGSQPLTIITTHLSPFVQSRNVIRDNRVRSALRARQISEILQWVQRTPGRTIITGDMNSIYLMGELAPFSHNNYSDVFDGNSSDCPGTFPLKPDMLRLIRNVVPFAPKVITLDYIFVSPGIEVLSAGVKNSPASDHYPVIAGLLVKRGG